MRAVFRVSGMEIYFSLRGTWKTQGFLKSGFPLFAGSKPLLFLPVWQRKVDKRKHTSAFSDVALDPRTPPLPKGWSCFLVRLVPPVWEGQKEKEGE
jgi:hypothetical protein